MAQSLSSDFKIYHAQFDSGFVETLQQETVAFNDASQGAIRLIAESLRGHYDYDSFFDVIPGLVSRRDITSTGDASDTPMTQDEQISVKLNRKVGPIGVSLDSMKKKERDPRQVSFLLGEMTAKHIQVDYLNTALAALEGALDTVSSGALEHNALTGGAPNTIVTNDLVDGLSKFGDASGNVIIWVMHSKPWHDLIKDQVTNAIYRANGVSIMEGVPSTMGRPVIVTDSASLKQDDEPSSNISAYSILGLVAGAAQVVESEPPTMVTDLITGKENIFYRVQGEHAYNLRLKGLKWDTSAGGVNPTDSAVATGTNWPKAVTSDKLLPGVLIKTR